MNLHNVASNCVSAVNPWLMATWYQSDGFETNADGRRAPDYAVTSGVGVQMQALTYKDLMQLDGINLNGVANALYVNGDIKGVSRPDARGGDIFSLADNSVWLVVHVLENWNRTSGWTKCVVVQQNDWAPPVLN